MERLKKKVLKSRDTGGAKVKKIDYQLIEPKQIVFYNSEKMQHMFVYLSKETISDLNSSEMAVYVVLCCNSRVESNKWIPLSQSMVAQYTGLSRITVNRAIHSLIDRDLVKSDSRSGSQRWRYKVECYRKNQIKEGKENRDLFQFYKSIVLNGTWAKLSPEAKRVYIAMRELAYSDVETYNTVEHDELVESTAVGEYLNDGYSSRKWDPLPLEWFNDNICNKAQVKPGQAVTALEQLTAHALVAYDPIEIGAFKVFLKPEYGFK